MAEKFKVAVNFSYHTLAELEDDDLAIEVLNMIRQKKQKLPPATPEQQLIEKLQGQLDESNTQNYSLRTQLGALTKAIEKQNELAQAVRNLTPNEENKTPL